MQSIIVNFLSGNNYPEFSNVGNFKIIATEKDTLKKTSNSNYEFDAYSTLKKPLQVVVSKNKSFAILKANKKTFLLG